MRVIWLDYGSRIPFDEEVQMLIVYSCNDESRNSLSLLEYIRMRNEMGLGEAITEKYHKGYL